VENAWRENRRVPLPLAPRNHQKHVIGSSDGSPVHTISTVLLQGLYRQKFTHLDIVIRVTAIDRMGLGEKHNDKDNYNDNDDDIDPGSSPARKGHTVVMGLPLDNIDLFFGTTKDARPLTRIKSALHQMSRLTGGSTNGYSRKEYENHNNGDKKGKAPETTGLELLFILGFRGICSLQMWVETGSSGSNSMLFVVTHAKQETGSQDIVHLTRLASSHFCPSTKSGQQQTGELLMVPSFMKHLCDHLLRQTVEVLACHVYNYKDQEVADKDEDATASAPGKPLVRTKRILALLTPNTGDKNIKRAKHWRPAPRAESIDKS
jgi:hypothetical protein